MPSPKARTLPPPPSTTERGLSGGAAAGWLPPAGINATNDLARPLSTAAPDPTAAPEPSSPTGQPIKTIELGVTGTSVFAGQIMVDPNAELRFPNSAVIYDKMRRSDGQVQAALLAMLLPILSLQWDVEPHQEANPDGKTKKDPKPEAVEQARTIKTDLLEGLSTPWRQTLHDILLMLPFGFSMMEPVYTIGEDGLVHLNKLAARLPTSLFRWQIARNGDLRGIVQRAVNPETGGIETVPIEADDLLVFTHNKEGANWEGQSVLRAAYKHYYYKDWLYRIGVVNTERGGGFPVISLPDGAGERDIAAARDVGESLHLHERAYVMEPAGYKFRLEGATGSRIGDVLAQVNHHDTKIFIACLLQFLQFGTQGGGAGTGRAMTGEFVDVFMMAIEGVIAEIEDPVNRRLIPKWCDYNWRVPGGPGVGYPRLKAQNVRGLMVRRAATVLTNLVTGRIIVPDDKLEAFVRAALDLPEADPSTARYAVAEGETPPEGGEPGQPGVEPAPDPDDPNPNDEEGIGEPAEAELAEYGTVQVDLAGDVANQVARFRRALPEDDVLEDGGPPHVTVRYGFTSDDPAPVMAALRGRGPAQFKLGQISRFTRPDRDVLMVRVQSRDLERMHQALAEVPHVTTQKRYVPHLTLAYLKKGKGAAYLGDRRFEGIALTADRVTVRPAAGAGVVVPLTERELREPGWGDGPLVVRRALTSLERNVALEEIDLRTKRSALELLTKIQPIQAEQVEALATLSRRSLDRVTDATAPAVSKLAAALLEVLAGVFQFGRAQVIEELWRQGVQRRIEQLFQVTLADVDNAKGAREFLAAKADVLARRWADRLVDATINAKLQAVRSGLTPDATEARVRDILGALSDRGARAMVYQSISEAFAIGRRVEAEEQRERIRSVQRSAVLDGNACDRCEELDGAVGAMDDPEMVVPDPDCEGERHGQTCRCLVIYVGGRDE